MGKKSDTKDILGKKIYTTSGKVVTRRGGRGNTVTYDGNISLVAGDEVSISYIDEKDPNYTKEHNYLHMIPLQGVKDIQFRKNGLTIQGLDNTRYTIRTDDSKLVREAIEATGHPGAGEQMDAIIAHQRNRRLGKSFVLLIGVLGIISGFFFISHSITGNIVAEGQRNLTGSILGVGLIVIGCVVVMFSKK